MAAGMEAAGREQGALVSLTAAGSSPAAHRQALDAIRGMRPRALVIASASFADTPREDVLPELQRLEADGCTIVDALIVGRPDAGAARQHMRHAV